MSRKFLGTWHTSFPERVWIEGENGFYHSIPTTKEDHERRMEFCLQMRRNHIEPKRYIEETKAATKVKDAKDEETKQEDTDKSDESDESNEKETYEGDEEE